MDRRGMMGDVDEVRPSHCVGFHRTGSFFDLDEFNMAT